MTAIDRDKLIKTFRGHKSTNINLLISCSSLQEAKKKIRKLGERESATIASSRRSIIPSHIHTHTPKKQTPVQKHAEKVREQR
jgi:hypothetical protein